MNKEMICIVCPLSCHLNVTQNNDEITVSGNSCPRGAIYAQKELTHPTRMLTSTVAIANAGIELLPVKTSQAIPKEKMKDVMKIISKIHVSAPIKREDIIVKNIAQSGADLIASRSVSVKKRT